ncbi:hypothetical protein LVD15_09480 [Fulvivirga maritima]|uniref:hypothetical protein n=1 Tax=Fulvivirga maritima TaxID=2904247 RepID=UPI001F21BBD8|nr:hypothetical protein [Fulvivirga maritima]UII28637.1 hypothetical protein LVD15_09480 [Fulvivirga maritima]
MKKTVLRVSLMASILFAIQNISPINVSAEAAGDLRYCKCNGKCKGKGGCCKKSVQLAVAIDELC